MTEDRIPRGKDELLTGDDLAVILGQYTKTLLDVLEERIKRRNNGS